MKKKILSLASALLVASIATGCSNDSQPNTPENKVVNGQGEKQSLFQEYMKNRPSKDIDPIGVNSADLVFSGIAGIYGNTVDLTDKYISKVENSKVALTLEEVRKTLGEEEYKKQVAALEGEDKKEYEAFLKSESNSLNVAASYLTDALKLQVGLTSINVQELVSNPFKLPSALKSSKLAKDQISYTVDTLKWLNETKKVYDASLEYKGR